MKKFITLSFILFVSTQIHAQSRRNTIKGNGKIVQQSRSTGTYDGINVAGFFDVTLVSGEEGNISIEGESNLLEYIEVAVKNNILKIRASNNKNIKISRGKKIKIRIPFEELNSVSLSGSGEIISKDVIKTNDIQVTVSGSGDVHLNVDAKYTKSKVTGSGDLVLKGKTDKHDTSVTGSGDIDAAQFKALYVDASVTGSGDLQVYSGETLNARVTGSGDIEYFGNPDKQETKVRGSGDISRG